MQKLQERLTPARPDLNTSSISVIVCTRDRPEHLQKCLQSLRTLSHQPKEIIIVDNAPRTDATFRLVREIPGIRYVPELRPGLSVARNTGIRHSSGEIIAFTDDDVTVHPQWIARLAGSFGDPKVMAVTGLIIPAELDTEAQFIFQQGHGGFGWGYRALMYDSHFFDQMKDRGAPVWHIGAGANMAFRRKAFELFGDFDERLGAGASGCSEDSEFWYRVLAEGWLCRYEPTAVVYHSHRSDLKGLKHQLYQYMRGHMAALLFQFDKYHHWGNLYRAFIILPRYYLAMLLHQVLPGFKPQVNMLGSQMAGCAAGVKFYLKHRRSPESGAETNLIPSARKGSSFQT